MRQPQTQPPNQRGAGSGAQKATNDNEQDERGRFTKNNEPAGNRTEKPSPSEKEREQEQQRDAEQR